jgi:hypothetical protein
LKESDRNYLQGVGEHTVLNCKDICFEKKLELYTCIAYDLYGGVLKRAKKSKTKGNTTEE